MGCIGMTLQSTLIAIGIALLASSAFSQDGSRVREAFSRLDVNKDGKPSEAESASTPALHSRLKGADTDADGFLSFQEFAQGIVRSLEGSSTMPESEDSAGLSTGEQTRNLMVDGSMRRYDVYVPRNYDEKESSSVIIAFHGGGGNPDTMIRISQLNKKSEEAGFLVVYPYGSGLAPDKMLTFNGGECCGYAMHEEVDEIAFLNAMLDDLSKVAKVDEGAVFATGLSNGAIMSYRAAAELAERIAAIAPVGGPLMLESISPSQPVAVMHFHGTADKFAPFEGGYGENSRGGPGVTDFRSVEYSLQAWIDANDCEANPTIEKLPDTTEDGMSSIRKTWSSTANETEVVLIEIEGGGHTWPGVTPPQAASFLGASTKDFSANDLMWDFFQKHRRDS
ncbi:MAG: hypothetical protein AAGF67_01030 [Verrucomicrobiota bacterium]